MPGAFDTSDTDSTVSSAAVVDAEGFLIPEASQPQDWARLADYLGEHGFSFTPEPAPKQFAGGMGNLNYLLELDGTPCVIRRPPPGPLPPGANDMAREHRVLSRLWEKFPLAPRAFHFCDDESVWDKPFFIMEYRTGRVVRKGEWPDDLVGHEAVLSERMISALAGLHAIDPAAVGLDTLGRPEGFNARTVEGWIKRCTIAAQDIYDDKQPPPAARDAAEWLRANIVPESGVALLHNDYKIDNIMWAEMPPPPEAIAIFDWDQCTRGDPLFDFATFLSYWAEDGDPEPMRSFDQMPTIRPGFPSRREVVELYAKASGRDVSDFLFHRVLGMLKLGVIFLQLFARYRRGETRDPRYADLGQYGDSMFEFTVDIIHGRTF